MGAGTSKPEQHRQYEAKYRLDSAEGVRLLLGDYHALTNRQFQGDYAAVDILVDLATAIERAGLTEKQACALRLVFVEDLTQKEAGVRLGVKRDTVSRTITAALTKIASIYESWAWQDEGYTLSYVYTIKNEWASTYVSHGNSYAIIKQGKRRTHK